MAPRVGIEPTCLSASLVNSQASYHLSTAELYGGEYRTRTDLNIRIASAATTPGSPIPHIFGAPQGIRTLKIQVLSMARIPIPSKGQISKLFFKEQTVL